MDHCRRTAATDVQRVPLYENIVCLLFFALVECLLWGPGEEALIVHEAPSVGFSGLAALYVNNGYHYQPSPPLRRDFNGPFFSFGKPPGAMRILVVGGFCAQGFP